MSTNDPMRGMMGTVVMYGAPPINIDPPGLPWIPDPSNPFTPGIQPIPATLPKPPFTVAQGGPEPIEQIMSRVATRIEQIKAELAKMRGLERELEALQRMVVAVNPPETERTER